MPRVSPGKMKVWGLECWSDRAFWSQGGREVIKSPTRKGQQGSGGVHPLRKTIIWLPLRSMDGNGLSPISLAGAGMEARRGEELWAASEVWCCPNIPCTREKV